MRYTPRMYIVVRRDLDMPPGKMAAQVAHAAVRCVIAQVFTQNLDDYFDETKGNEAKIVLGCDTLAELLVVEKITEDNKICCQLVTDSGKTVFDKPTITCLGIGPVTEEQEVLFKHLKLY